MKLRSLIIATCLAVVTATASQAAVIGAVGATINSGGPGFGDIADTFNQNGLSSNYVNGKGRFYPFASTTTHTPTSPGNGWISNALPLSVSVTYVFRHAYEINKMALWIEDLSMVEQFDLSVSLDGVNFSSLVMKGKPTINPSGTDYYANVFRLESTWFQFFRFDMDLCHQAQHTFGSCAIGEVVFRSHALPLPAGLPLLLTSLGAIGFMRRRK